VAATSAAGSGGGGGGSGGGGGGLNNESSANEEREELRYHGRRRRSTSFHLSPTMMGHWMGQKTETEEAPKPPQPTFRAINHPAVQSLRVEQVN